MIPEIVQAFLWLLACIAVAVASVSAGVIGGPWLVDWIERRPLVKLARQYGIEHVPGEDLARLREIIVKRRNEGLGEP